MFAVFMFARIEFKICATMKVSDFWMLRVYSLVEVCNV